MPGEFGTFLALTNTRFSGSEAIELLGLADYMITPSDDLDYILQCNSTLIDSTISAFYLNRMNSGMKDFKEEAKGAHNRDRLLYERKYRKLEDLKFIPPWEVEQLASQKHSEKVDIQYKDYLRDHAFSKYLHDTVKLGSGHTGHYINHYKYNSDHVRKNLPVEPVDLHGSILRKYEKDINRCFYADTIEEIIENLKKENTKFAKYCLDRFEN